MDYFVFKQKLYYHTILYILYICSNEHIFECNKYDTKTTNILQFLNAKIHKTAIYMMLIKKEFFFQILFFMFL